MAAAGLLALSVVVGVAASSFGRNGVGWFYSRYSSPAD
jgi:hypothetical protein